VIVRQHARKTLGDAFEFENGCHDDLWTSGNVISTGLLSWC
jgi:hypothetical protein